MAGPLYIFGMLGLAVWVAWCGLRIDDALGLAWFRPDPEDPPYGPFAILFAIGALFGLFGLDDWLGRKGWRP